MTRSKLIVPGEGTSTDAFTGLDWLVVGTLSLIWGASFLLIAIGLESLHPGVIAWTRLILGATALAAFRRARIAIAAEDRARVVFVGIASAGLPALLFAWAEQTVPSALAGMLVAATPIATVVVRAVLTARWPGGPQRWGLLVGFVGVVLLAAPDLTGEGATVGGIVMVLVAVFSYGLGNNLYPPLQQRYGALATMMWAQLAAAIALTPLGLAGIPSSHFEWRPVVAVLTLGILGTGIARGMHVALLGRVGPARGAIAGYTIPIVALVLGVLVLDERVVPLQVMGVAVAVVGARMVGRREG